MRGNGSPGIIRKPGKEGKEILNQAVWNVWRTLWLETQEMVKSTAEGPVIAETPSADGIVANELARACIRVETIRMTNETEEETKIPAIEEVEVSTDTPSGIDEEWFQCVFTCKYTC